jgi:hypothetical protein
MGEVLQSGSIVAVGHAIGHRNGVMLDTVMGFIAE